MINAEFKNPVIQFSLDLLIMVGVWLYMAYGCISSLIFDSEQRRFLRKDYLDWRKR